MANIRWEGQNLVNLLTLDIPTLVQMYKFKPNYLALARHRKRKQIKTGDLKMPEQLPVSNQATEEVVDGNLVSTIEGWWDVVVNGPDGPETIRAYRHSTKTRHDEAAMEQFEPAAPARITPSKRKAPQRDFRTLFVFSDAQIDYRRLESGELDPIHDERAIKVATMLCADLQPDEIINLGDTVDLAALSRFKLDSNHFQRTLGPSFQRVHDMYAQFRSDNPSAKITEVDSNHNTRLKDFMLKNAPDMYGFKRPGESQAMFTYGYMANLEHVGVDFVSGYGAAEYMYGEDYDAPPIRFIHGSTVASNASTAAKESKANPENHIVRGHGHRLEQHTRTTRAGRYLASLQIGALCRTTGEVPSYHSGVDDSGNVVKYQEDWQQSVLVIRDYDGDYEFQNVPIRDGIALYNGRLYNGEAL